MSYLENDCNQQLFNCSKYILKILVTGGLGFLGGRIAQHLLNEGHNVLVGTRNDIKLGDRFLDGARVVQTSWNDSAKLEEICAGVDLIIHASGMNAKDCLADAARALDVNAVATANLLQSAIKQNVRRYLYISSIHVYADNLQGEISEADCPANLHPYAASHRAAENTVFWAQKNGLIDGIVVRFSNGFGVPTRRDANCWMLLINDLCRQAVEHKQLVLASNGMQSRNFIPISEMCSAIDFLACKLPPEHRVGQAGPINVGGQTSFSVLEMAKLIQSRCGSILGYEPELLVREQGGCAQNPQLDYKLNRLKALGYSHSHNPIEEIDSLLIYCHNNFRDIYEP